MTQRQKVDHSCPETPVCERWAGSIDTEFRLLQEFGDWFSEVVIKESQDQDWIDYPCPDGRWFERFMKEKRDFSFDELEKERRALLDYQRALNERPVT